MHQTKIQELEKTTAADQAKLKELKNQVQNIKNAHQAQLQESGKTTAADKATITKLEKKITTNQATIQELRKQKQNIEAAHQAEIKKLEKGLKNTQVQNEAIKKLREKISLLEEEKNSLQTTHKAETNKAYLLSSTQMHKTIEYYEEKLTENQAVIWKLQAQPEVSREQWSVQNTQLKEANQALIVAQAKIAALTAQNNQKEQEKNRLTVQLNKTQELRTAHQQLSLQHQQLQQQNTQLLQQHQVLQLQNNKLQEENQRLAQQLQAQNRSRAQNSPFPRTSHMQLSNLHSKTFSHPSFGQWGTEHHPNEPVQFNHVFPSSLPSWEGTQGQR
jgi:chromosome segregation ATPase